MAEVAHEYQIASAKYPQNQDRIRLLQLSSIRRRLLDAGCAERICSHGRYIDERCASADIWDLVTYDINTSLSREALPSLTACETEAS